MSVVRKIVLRAATDTQSSRALRAAVRDCTYIKASSIIALRQSRGLRLNTKAGQALMRHINRTRLHMLYSRAQVGGRAAWMGLRRRVSEAQSHPLVVARKQRLVALRQRYFLRRRNDSNTAVASNIRKESNGVRENEVTTISQAWQKYGWLAIGTHFSVYFATLAGLTFGMKNGFLGSDEKAQRKAVQSIARKIDGYVPDVVVHTITSSPTWGAFAHAWVTAKFTEPPRLAVTFFLVPRLYALRSLLPTLWTFFFRLSH